MDSDLLLVVDKVSKTFPVKSGMFSSSKGVVHAVNNVSFQVRRGETFGLVGESGCGKSTLSRTILRLIEADSGQILFEGKDIMKMNNKELRKQRENMRMVFQKPFDSLNPRQTVRETISAPFKIHRRGEYSNQMIEKKVLELLDYVGLSSSYIDRYPHEFSGGQRQRVGIARALALEPKLIICDEPVSALDVSIQSQILNLLKDLQKEFKLTYIFISHNLSVVKHMADRIAVMYLGSIVEIGDSKDLYNNAEHPYTKALLSAILDPEAKKNKERIILKGDIPSPVNPPKGCLFSTRCPLAVDKCMQERPELESLGSDYKVACFLHKEGGGKI
ncbi:ABC transporter ATP-binding protein [Clostridium magnum]|uniref:Oligopeptide transport ATP-binding protein OppF n=1 Tax=Clostridium magnum DSM 2767 TaxID=1121326 RepID=A0A161YFW8_9CLOT|nr:dipeptide ABC transporter ATP-binding protein [Clostridium magnum]KZL89002.1 oligopeptide transport ATP-binding protein OppF [Clostridium magnum DSM 2767]SHI23383.1 oligopeptide transport system ATP-binding protein [Clostridium magnum DSM 2767]